MFLLPLIILIPFISIVPILILDRRYSYTITLIASIISFILVILSLIYAKIYGLATLSFITAYIPQLNVGINIVLTQATLILMLMTSVVFLSASIVGQYFIGKRERIYNVIFLLAEGSSLGVFLSGNLFLFYIFWEISEFMMFFMIFIYGGYNRRYASIKFIVYSLISSLLLLIGIMLLYLNTNPHTFDISLLQSSASALPQNIQLLVLALLLISFVIKMPVFPLHTWLPDAHTEAPTTGSMILAGVLLKFGGYGLLLLFLLVPLASKYSLYILLLFLFSSGYSALVTLRQSNLKRLIAYTSITDMGIVGIGIAAMNVLGSTGSIYLMLSHGLAISLLFLIAGTLDEIYGTLEISKIRGVIKHFRSLAYLFIAASFAAIGLPLTSGFVADILLFIGSFNAFGPISLVAIASILLIGAALFWIVERSFMNISKVTEPFNILENRVILSAVLLLFFSVLLGILPSLLLGYYS